MTTYSKPSVRSAWGQTASGSDLQDPGDSYASKGWQIGLKPPRQYFNWALNYVFQGIRYLCQQGIAQWDAAETYPQYGLTQGPSNKRLYLSLISNNTNQNPETTPLLTSWDVPYVPTAPAGDNTVRIANTNWVVNYALPLGSTFSSIGGQVSNGQVPVGAVTQWQGSLSIGGGQVTSAVARANSFQLSNGNYVTPQWSGQSGQPTWLFGSNDGANVLVWNPANFSVANAAALNGWGQSSAVVGNSIVQRGSDGSIYAYYLNTTSPNNENPSISQFIVTNGSDGFERKASVAAVQAALGALTSANFAFSSSGYQKIASGAIIQGGRATVNGLTAVFFPIAFPNGCFAVVFTNEGSTNQLFLNSPPSKTFFQATNGNAVIDWIAFGW